MPSTSHLLGATLRLFTKPLGRLLSQAWTILCAHILLRRLANRSGKTARERRHRRNMTHDACREFLDSRIDIEAFIPAYAQAITPVLLAARVLPNDGKGHYDPRTFRAHHPSLPDRGVLVRATLARAESAHLRHAFPRAFIRTIFRAALNTRNIPLPQMSAHTVLAQARTAMATR